MYQQDDPSSSEKKSPNISNLQHNQSVNLCICDKIVFDKPITLPCGHKYHFKCAREYIFNAQTDQEGDGCILCRKQSCSFDLSVDAMEEEIHLKFTKINYDNDFKGKTFESSSNSYASQQIGFPSNDISFKYQTPNTSKYPKQSSRYSNQDTNSTSKQNKMNSFMLSPALAALRNTQERVPFTDITAQITKQSSHTNMLCSNKNKLAKIEQNNEECEQLIGLNTNNLQSTQQSTGGFVCENSLQPFSLYENERKQNFYQKNKNGNYIQVLGEKIIRNSYENRIKKFSNSSSSSFSSGLENFNHRNDIMGINLSGSEIMHSMSLSSSSASSLMNSSFFQPNLLTSQLPLHNNSRLNQIKQFLYSSQVMAHSINNSMISEGSDKENVRSITTRKAMNNVLQISFHEGTSYVCPSSLFTPLDETIDYRNYESSINPLSNPLSENSQQPQGRFVESENYSQPFIIQISNQYNILENPGFRNTQDVLVIILSDEFKSPEQRYSIGKALFSSLDPHDRLSLAWARVSNREIIKTSSDYFFGKEMSEIISMEFMRLQGNKQSKCSLVTGKQDDIVNSGSKDRMEEEMKQTSFSQFVEEQFQEVENRRMIQHLIVVRGQNTQLEFLNEIEEIQNILTSEVIIPQEDLNLTENSEFLVKCNTLLKRLIEPTRTINIKKIKLLLEINPFLNNLIDVSLINSTQTQARMQKTTVRNIDCSSRSSHNLITEEEEFEEERKKNLALEEEEEPKEQQENLNNFSCSSNASLKKFREITIEFLKEDKVELLFEVTFSKQIPPAYTRAQLFNCSIQYSFIFADQSVVLSNSSTFSANPQTNQVQNIENNVELQFQPFFEVYPQSLNNLYYLIDWRSDPSHLRYNRKVIFSFWKYSIQFSSDILYQQHVHDKFQRIFEAISEKRQNDDYEEYHQFTSHYQKQ